MGKAFFFTLFSKTVGNDVSDKTRDWPFGVSRKSDIRKLSAVAASGSSLKFPDIVFFEIHPKSIVASFVRGVGNGKAAEETFSA